MSAGPSNPARRAVARWAWRLFRREWRQQLATLTLITLAVAASVATTAIAVNAASTANSFVGDANALIRLDATDRRAADNAIAAATQRFGEVEVISHQQATVPGLDQMIDVRDQDPNGVYSHPTLALRAGRYPASSSEVAITNGVADLLGTHIGDEVDLGRVRRTVVGEVENPRDLDDEFALVATNTNDSADSLTVLVDTNNPEPSPTTDGAGPGAAPARGVRRRDNRGRRVRARGDHHRHGARRPDRVGRIPRRRTAPPAPARSARRHRRDPAAPSPGDARERRDRRRDRRGHRRRVGRHRLDRRRAGGRDLRRPSHRSAGAAMGPDCVVHGDRRHHGDCGGLVAGADDGPTPRDQRAVGPADPPGRGPPVAPARKRAGRRRHSRNRHCPPHRRPRPTAAPGRRRAGGGARLRARRPGRHPGAGAAGRPRTLCPPPRPA